MTDLHYFPLLASDWLAGEATSLMTPAQEGAFIRLLCRQWTSKELPCSLPNDDVRLAQLSRLGSDWLTIGAFVREQFEEVAGDPTRIRNRKLWAVYREAQQQHKKRVAAGKVGGETKAANRRGGQVAARQQDRAPSNARAGLGQCSSDAVALPSNQNQSQNQSHKPTSSGKPVSWPGEAALVWKAVAPIPIPRLGKALKPVVDEYGWPDTKLGLEAYVELNKGKPRRVEWFVGDAVRWLEIGKMPAIDQETGEPTERGRLALGVR